MQRLPPSLPPRLPTPPPDPKPRPDPKLMFSLSLSQRQVLVCGGAFCGADIYGFPRTNTPARKKGFLLEKKGFDAKTPTRDLGQAADNPTACTATPGRKAGPLRSLRARSGRARAFSSGCRFGEWLGQKEKHPSVFREGVCVAVFFGHDTGSTPIAVSALNDVQSTSPRPLSLLIACVCVGSLPVNAFLWQTLSVHGVKTGRSDAEAGEKKQKERAEREQQKKNHLRTESWAKKSSSSQRETSSVAIQTYHRRCPCCFVCCLRLVHLVRLSYGATPTCDLDGFICNKNS